MREGRLLMMWTALISLAGRATAGREGAQILENDRQITIRARETEVGRRLMAMA
jgi:hypothetical protein